MRQKLLLKLHFGIVLFLLLNLAYGIISGWRLLPLIVFGPKMISFLSGMVLFFFRWKNRKLLKFYFGIYVFSPIIVVVGYLLDGILGAILASVFFLFFSLPEMVVSSGNFQVKTAYAGFLSACCHYSLYETKGLVLEKNVRNFRLDAMPVDIKKLEISENQQAVITFRDENGTADTSIVKLP